MSLSPLRRNVGLRPLVVIFAVVVILSLSTGIGAADITSSPAQTAVNNTTNATQTGVDGTLSIAAQTANNTTTTQNHWVGVGTNASGGGGGGLLGMMDPGKWVKKGWEGLVSMFMAAIFKAVDPVRDTVASFPAPGQAGKPMTWLHPQNGWWPKIQQAMPYSMGVASLLLIWGSVLAFRHRSPTKRRAKLKSVGVGWFAVIGTWIWAPLIGHLTAELSGEIIPKTTELMKSPDELILGAGIGGVLAIFFTALFAVGIVALGMIHFLAHACVFLWPIAWAARTYDGFIESIGDTIVYTYGIVCVINIFQALILRLIYELPFGKQHGFIGFVTVAGGLVFALVIFPKKMLEHANDAASMALGTRAAQKGAQQLGEKAQRRSRETAQQFVNSRFGNEGDGDGSPTNGTPDRTRPTSSMGVGSSREDTGRSKPITERNDAAAKQQRIRDSWNDGIDASSGKRTITGERRREKRRKHDQQRTAD